MGKNSSFFAGLILVLLSAEFCRSSKDSAASNSRDCYSGINKVDRNGFQQGYWKDARPDSNGHFRIMSEGLYLNGRRVGVWKLTNWDGSQVYKQEIFMDTSEALIQELNFDLTGKLVSKGMLTMIQIKDSIQVIDLKTNEVKWDTIVRQLIKDGPWEYFWPNGQLKSAGSFVKDKENGQWKFYDEKGNLVRTREY